MILENPKNEERGGERHPQEYLNSAKKWPGLLNAY
jgi:hypothetical protein